MGGMEVLPGRKGEPGSSVSDCIVLHSCIELFTLHNMQLIKKNI